MVRKLSIVISLVVVCVMAMSAIAQANGPTIDLSRDENKDGLSDVLVEEVARVAQSKDQEAAIADMVSRLPYSPKTRELQEEAMQLHAKLAKTQDEREAQEIINALEGISDQMMADPNYAQTIKTLTTLFAPESRNLDRKTGQVVATESVNWGLLQRGDIMLVRSGGNTLGQLATLLYAMWYSHAGNYDGNSLVYESNADGVRLKPLSKWQTSGSYIGLGYDNKRTVVQVQSSVDWAKNKYGTDGRTPYNLWYPDKNTDSSLYCSQLTWKIHTNLGVNLDSNHSQYQNWIAARWGWWAVYLVSNPAVAPDEIGLDSDVTMYSTGWN